MAKMNFTPADEFVDEVWGKIGTPERNGRAGKGGSKLLSSGRGYQERAHQAEPYTGRIRGKSRSEEIPNLQIGEWQERYNSTHYEQSIQGSGL